MAAFNDVAVRSSNSRNPEIIKLLGTTASTKRHTDRDAAPLDGETIFRWCNEFKPWLDQGQVMRVSFGFGRGSTTTVLEEYIFDIRGGSPRKDDVSTASDATGAVVELLHSIRFLSQTFDEIDVSGAGKAVLVAFAKVYADRESKLQLSEKNAFQDALGDGVSFYDKPPFQLRVGLVHTSSGHVVTMGVSSSLDSLNDSDTRKANSCAVPDNLQMCSSEDGVGRWTTPKKRPMSPDAKMCTNTKKRGRLAALHFNSESI